LHNVLHVPHAFSRHLDGANFGQGQSTLAINYPNQALGYAAPEIDTQPVPGTNDILRAHGHVHRQPVEVASTVAEDIRTKAFQHSRTS
jgi:hypothetical protein